MTPRLAWSASLATIVIGCTSAPAPSGGEVTPSPSATPGAASPPQVGATIEPTLVPTAEPSPVRELTFSTQLYPVPAGSHPHDVAPAADGGVWYTAQHTGELGWLDPESGATRRIPLGAVSAPHGVIVGPDRAAWVTDSDLNAILRVDAETDEVTSFPLPASAPRANLNTAAFDGDGLLWFTGQAGWYGSVDPASGEVRAFPAPGGTGPYGIAATPDGEIWFVSLAGRYLADVDEETGEVTPISPPSGSGLRRVWSDSTGRLWVSEWDAGQVGVYDPETGEWREWRLPEWRLSGNAPQAYSVYVDETDAVWLTDFGANAIVRFDPITEGFMVFPADHVAAVRQMLGRPGEVWGAESAADNLIVIRYGH